MPGTRRACWWKSSAESRSREREGAKRRDARQTVSESRVARCAERDRPSTLLGVLLSAGDQLMTRVFGFFGNVLSVLGMALVIPIAILVVGTPVVLVISVLVGALERL